MKKILYGLLITVLLLTSCSRIKDPPYGVWESQDPHMIVCFEADQNDYYYGTYYKDDIEIETVIVQGYSGVFNIYDVGFASNDEEISYAPYFAGNVEVKSDGFLYFELLEHWQELTGYDVIIFEKVEGREPPAK